MNNKDLIAVTSRSFSNNITLRKELLQKYSKVRFNDKNIRLDNDTLVEFLKGCSKAITALEKIDKSIVSKIPSLKVISKYGVGIDMIDQQALKDYNIKFNFPKGVNKRSVSELTLSMMISLLHRVSESSQLVVQRHWKQVIGKELTGKKIGIIGSGNIGKDLIKLLIPFKCKIFINDILDQPKTIYGKRCYQVSLNELLRLSDVITLHTPLDHSTKNLISTSQFSKMKINSIIINNARGGLINEKALLKFIESGHIGGAGLDVFSEEPPIKSIYRKLIDNPKIIVTSHIGGSSEEAIIKMGRAAISGLDI